MMKSLIVIGAAVLLSATVAMAQQRGQCAADIKAKCAGVQRGERRLSACVKEHLTEFSEPCQARLAKIATVGNACKADVTKSCAGKSRMWLNLAAAQFLNSEKENRESAVQARDLAASKLTPAQIAEAQKLAREWKPKPER